MSLVYKGAIVSVIIALARFFGLEIGSEELTRVLEMVIALVAFGATIWGRYRHRDVTPLGIKK
jgi:hypothetical protein